MVIIEYLWGSYRISEMGLILPKDNFFNDLSNSGHCLFRLLPPSTLSNGATYVLQLMQGVGLCYCDIIILWGYSNM